MSSLVLGPNGAYDEDYLDHLHQLSDGSSRVEALLAYKNDSYGINGSLKAGTPGFATQADNLQRAIRAVSSTKFAVYRMTSVHDFAVSLVPYLEHHHIVYPAFVSASRNQGCIERFFPPVGEALALEIEVPPGFPFALMEVNGYSGEDEVLLPFETETKTRTQQFLISFPIKLQRMTRLDNTEKLPMRSLKSSKAISQ